MTCTLWSYKTRILQAFNTDVVAQYACLFALCMDRGFSPDPFYNHIRKKERDWQIESAFVREFGQ